MHEGKVGQRRVNDQLVPRDLRGVSEPGRGQQRHDTRAKTPRRGREPRRRKQSKEKTTLERRRDRRKAKVQLNGAPPDFQVGGHEELTSSREGQRVAERGGRLPGCVDCPRSGESVVELHEGRAAGKRGPRPDTLGQLSSKQGDGTRKSYTRRVVRKAARKTGSSG